MSLELKIYKTDAYFVKNKRKIRFTFECRAHKIEDVLERVYNEVGSRHRVKRTEIFISKADGIKEISPEDSAITLWADLDQPDFKLKVD